MKTSILAAAVCASVLPGCVLPGPPSVVVRESNPAPVYVERQSVYQPGYTVNTLAPGYRTVRYGRNVYYVDHDTYYRRNRGGYVVVQRPY